jgi:hypothetical protein
MSTEIKYKNFEGELLTPQQLAVINDDYSKEQYIDDKLKRVDYYIRGSINWGAYYLEDGENIQSVLTGLGEVWQSTLLFLDEQAVGGYVARNWEVYQGANKLDKGRTVYDSLNREVGEETLSLNTLDVIKVTKKYYLDQFGPFIDDGYVLNFGTFEFTYDSPGLPSEKIRVWVNLPGFDHKDYPINDQRNELTHPIIRKIFIWEDHPYYHSSSPFIPISIV